MTVTVVTTVVNDIDKIPISQQSSRKSRRSSRITHYVQAGPTVENTEKTQHLQSSRARRRSASRQKNRSKSRTRENNKGKEYRQSRRRISPNDSRMETSKTTVENGGTKSSRRGRKDKPSLTVDTSAPSSKSAYDTPRTAASTPSSPSPTPAGVRGRRDLRSPGASKTPVSKAPETQAALPDFITQTDANGNAVTPRSEEAISSARKLHPSGPEPHLHVNRQGKLTEQDENGIENVDACETLLDGIRLMCCCLMPEEEAAKSKADPTSAGVSPSGTAISTDSMPEDDRVKLLPKHHPDDFGKKCLVLDLDETLVHSSFRAVPGADFVIPVQIEDVVHFVYVAKRPGVDEFLVEMAKHYEIVIYTASLNKYADPLLDLLDPEKVIRTRLFRESCVFYEGNYVKDLSLLDRDLSQAIIIDNSPSSYMFHPENAIDCTSFIDDPMDRELDQIGDFLAGIKDVQDVRNLAPRWREWPRVNLKEYETTRENGQ